MTSHDLEEGLKTLGENPWIPAFTGVTASGSAKDWC